MLIQHLEVRRGEYHDSVTLMLAARAVGAVAGVDAALVAMGTELNLELLAGMGYSVEVAGAGSEAARAETVGANDLIVAFSHSGGGTADAALAALATALSTPADGARGSGEELLPPRTTATALRRTSGSLALISTPGSSAAVEAADALEEGASVIVFSDNVPLDQELRLKEEARRRGLLVMGPDCGTVVLNGVGYGFANVVRPGPVSLVAASGTGAQEVMCLLAAAGVGTRHCLGVGGRDLTPTIRGRSTHAALEALDADAGTELIVVVTKPPDPAVARGIRERATLLATPVVFAMVGDGHPDLTAAVAEVLRELEQPVPAWPVWLPEPDRGIRRTGLRRRTGTTIRGLFSGGTLCAEAKAIIGSAGHGVESLTDFGDDAYTRGRPHPMIDNTLRIEAVAAAAADPGTGVLLLDVVLGRGAHPDPAAELAPSLAKARADRGDLPVVVSLCGTVADPQGLERQARALTAAGAAVHLSNAAAARAAVELIGDPES